MLFFNRRKHRDDRVVSFTDMDLLYDAAVAWTKLLCYRYDIICGKKKKLYPISLDFEEWGGTRQ